MRRRAASAGGWTPSTARRSSSPELPAGTWRFGLDRLLLGVTMTEDEQRLFGGVLPLDDVESGAIDLAGRLAELVDRLHARGRRAERAADGPGVGGGARGGRRRADRDRPARRVAARGAAAAARRRRARGRRARRACSSSAEVRALLAERLQGRPTRANFRTGHLTICTLVPMRSVPHRVVCLLGLDDGTFPRKAPRDGDDLMLDDPHVGERDSRTEDRQLLLDALLAATRPADHHLHRPRRAHEPRRARRRCRSASCSTSSGATWSSSTRCSRSTRATSRPARPGASIA